MSNPMNEDRLAEIRRLVVQPEFRSWPAVELKVTIDELLAEVEQLRRQVEAVHSICRSRADEALVRVSEIAAALSGEAA